MKYFIILACSTICFLSSCKDSTNNTGSENTAITPVKQGTVFKYQHSSINDGISQPADSFKIADSIALLDTIVRAKHSIKCHDGYGKDGFHYVAYEADGNVSVLIDEGDLVWVKLPISGSSSTFVLDTVVHNLNDSDHWIFTAKKIGSETSTINGKSFTSIHIEVTWQAANKTDPIIPVEVFSYWFSPQLGYFIRSDLEYLPVVTGGVDALEKRVLIDWK